MSILYNVSLLCREAGNQSEINRFVNENMIGLSILSILIENRRMHYSWILSPKSESGDDDCITT
jgi:hypothetical protein